MPDDELKYAVEAILFASERPLSPEDIKVAFDGAVTNADISEALSMLAGDYQSQRRGFTLIQIAGGFQIVTDPRFAEILKKFYQSREKKKLSPASLETLSIIAYKQPVTKADIEFIRGVDVDGPLKTLLEKGLIRIAGRKEVPGRPILYGTTRDFLERFGLGSLKELPPLSEFTQKDIDPSLLPPELKRPETAETNGAGESAETEETSGAVLRTERDGGAGNDGSRLNPEIMNEAEEKANPAEASDERE